MKIYTVKLSGENVPLRFDMAAWERLEDELCLLDELADKLTQRGRIKALAQVLAILSGKQADAIRAAMKPADVRTLTQAAWLTINEGMKMDTTPDGEDQVIDLTLKEIEKKEERDG